MHCPDFSQIWQYNFGPFIVHCPIPLHGQVGSLCISLSPECWCSSHSMCRQFSYWFCCVIRSILWLRFCICCSKTVILVASASFMLRLPWFSSCSASVISSITSWLNLRHNCIECKGILGGEDGESSKDFNDICCSSTISKSWSSGRDTDWPYSNCCIEGVEFHR